jgi:hypothetical protein
MALEDAGYFYEIRMRLKGQIAHQKWTLGRPWTPRQEEAWAFLNEVEQLVKLLEKVEGTLDLDCQTELAIQIRRSVRAHLPGWASRAR